MTPTQTVRFVAVITQIWPSMKIDEHTSDAWHPILDDIDIDAALAAIRYLAKTKQGYISPADIRRRVAVEAGLIPETTEADGLALALAVAVADGEGASKLDPITYAAYRAMGGPTCFDSPPSILRPQWGKVWAQASAHHHERVLGGHLGQQVATMRALPAAPSVDQQAIESAPPTVDRSAETEQLIRNLAEKLPQTGRETLHPLQVEWERRQRQHKSRPEPNPHYRPDIALAVSSSLLSETGEETK